MDERTRQIALAALKIITPLLEELTLDSLRDLFNSRVDNIAKAQKAKGWSATNAADPKNDYPGDILSKWADDALFVMAQQAPGLLTDKFRDGLSPVVTPIVRGQIDENSTHEEVAQKAADASFAVISAVIQAATP